MAHADRESVVAAAEAYVGAGDRLAADLADRVTLTRVTSRLPDTLDRIEAQRAAGRSIVLVAVLLGAALSLAALLLAGRLVAAVRDEERVRASSWRRLGPRRCCWLSSPRGSRCRPRLWCTQGSRTCPGRRQPG
jgi:hypothetical protein